MPIANLSTATPVEIDTILAALWERESDALDAIEAADGRIFRAANMKPWRIQPDRYDSRVVGTLDEAMDLLTARGSHSDITLLGLRVNRLDDHKAIRAEIQPYTTEFDRRGGWTRAFLVLNVGGHVHSSQNCSTCFVRTRYGWLISLSGSTEAEIIEAAGSGACTVCYPSAPVDAKPRSVFHHTEVEAQAAAQARKDAKDARAAAKAAKAITAPDGGPLRIFDRHVPERVQVNRRTGVTRVIEAFDSYNTIETLAAAKMWLTDACWWNGRGDGEHPSFTSDRIAVVAAAVAHKNGTTPEIELAAAAKRAKNRK